MTSDSCPLCPPILIKHHNPANVRNRHRVRFGSFASILPCPLSRPQSTTPDITTSDRDPSACRLPAVGRQKSIDRSDTPHEVQESTTACQFLQPIEQTTIRAPRAQRHALSERSCPLRRDRGAGRGVARRARRPFFWRDCGDSALNCIALHRNRDGGLRTKPNGSDGEIGRHRWR